MRVAARHAIDNASARLHELWQGPDPVLLLAREGRWRWPWVIVGLIATSVLLPLSVLAGVYFEDFALQQDWISQRFPPSVYPLDPAQPITLIDASLLYPLVLFVPLFTLWAVHGVSWRRAFSFGIGFSWSQFWRAALAMLVLGTVATGLLYLLEPHNFHFPARRFAYVPWLLIGLGVIFVQAMAEEVLFRGYLLRAWGAVLPRRLPMVMILTGLFVAAHLWNEDLQQDLVLGASYFVVVEFVSFALLFRTQNLAASAGLHWMNNVAVTLMPSMPGQPTVLALAIYTDPVYAAGGSRLFDPLTHAASIVAIALLLVMLLWHRSPFHLAKAPVPASSHEGTTAAANGTGFPSGP